MVQVVQKVPAVQVVQFGIKRFERFERLGVNPIDWTAKRRNLEHRSREFLGLILYSDSLRLAVFLAKGRLGRSSD